MKQVAIKFYGVFPESILSDFPELSQALQAVNWQQNQIITLECEDYIDVWQRGAGVIDWVLGIKFSEERWLSFIIKNAESILLADRSISDRTYLSGEVRSGREILDKLISIKQERSSLQS